MSEKAKVRFSEIIERSGLSGFKVLMILGLPKCELIHIQNQPAGTEIEVKVYSESKSKTYKSTGRPVAISPALPVIDYIEIAGEYIAQFQYSEKSGHNKIVFADRVSIPMPPGWPKPYFLEERYPAPV